MAYQRLDLGRTEVCGRWYMHMTNSAWAEADGQHNLVFFCSNHCLKWSYELALSFRHIWSRSQLQKTISDTRKILRALWKQQIWKLRLGNIYSKKICIDRYVASPPNIQISKQEQSSKAVLELQAYGHVKQQQVNWFKIKNIKLYRTVSEKKSSDNW